MTDWKFQVRADDNTWATELYNSTGKISDAVAAQYVVVVSDTVGKYPIDVWFVAPKGKEFVTKENNNTDFVQIPYATKNNVLTKLYANGQHLSYSTEDSYAALSWDGTKYGGSYHLQITEKGVNDNLYFNRQDDGSKAANCYPYLHMQESSTPTPKEYDVVYNLTNCTVSPQPEKMVDGTTYNITVTPDSGYEIDDSGYVAENIPSIRYYDLDGQMQRGTYSNGVLTVTPKDVSGSITVTAKAVKSDTPTPTPTEYDVVYNLTNCTVSPKPDKMTDGTTYNLTVTPNDGYTIDGTPDIRYSDLDAQIKHGTYSNGVLTITPTDVYGSITVTAKAIQATPTPYDYGAAKAYSVTKEKLDAIADWFYSVGTVDISKYVYSLKRFFVDIPKADTVTVHFGKNDTNVSAQLINVDSVDIDCGTINIDGTYNNAVDYQSDIKFYLPFVGVINIEPKYVMGNTVSLVYHVNTITGDCVASLYVNGIEVGRSSGSMAYDIPFVLNDVVKNDIGKTSPEYLANPRPSVTIATPIYNAQYTVNNYIRDTISKHHGYCEFKNVTMSVGCTDTEYKMINGYLESGVIIA